MASRTHLIEWDRNGPGCQGDGDDDYRRVSSNDLRRCWAHHLLVEEGVSPRIVIALGGWNSYDAIEPYLAAPSESNILDQLVAAEL